MDSGCELDLISGMKADWPLELTSPSSELILYPWARDKWILFTLTSHAVKLYCNHGKPLALHIKGNESRIIKKGCRIHANNCITNQAASYISYHALNFRDVSFPNFSYELPVTVQVKLPKLFKILDRVAVRTVKGNLQCLLIAEPWHKSNSQTIVWGTVLTTILFIFAFWQLWHKLCSIGSQCV